MKLSVEKFEIEISPEDQKQLSDLLLELERIENQAKLDLADADERARSEKFDKIFPILNSLIPVFINLITKPSDAGTTRYTVPDPAFDDIVRQAKAAAEGAGEPQSDAAPSAPTEEVGSE